MFRNWPRWSRRAPRWSSSTSLVYVGAGASVVVGGVQLVRFHAFVHLGVVGLDQPLQLLLDEVGIAVKAHGAGDEKDCNLRQFAVAHIRKDQLKIRHVAGG